MNKFWIWLLLLSAIFFISFFSVYPFLAKTEIVGSDIMILEGWVTEETLDSAVSKFNSGSYSMIITAGGPLPKEEITMPYNSELKFKTEKILMGSSIYNRDISEIKVTASGTELDGIFAHFKVKINDSIVGDAFTSDQPKMYIFNVKVKPESIDSLSVIFDNDAIGPGEDRNFVFKSIEVNNRILSPFSNHVSLSRKKDKKLIKERLYKYFPERTAFMLSKKGIAKEKIIPISTPFVERDRTYESALSVKRYLSDHYPAIKSLNIVTEGTHARRSWLMYKKAFGNEYQIGIISIDTKAINSGNWWKSQKGIKYVMEQLAKYLYAKFWFIPIN